jgi:hypothetical protein
VIFQFQMYYVQRRRDGDRYFILSFATGVGLLTSAFRRRNGVLKSVGKYWRTFLIGDDDIYFGGLLYSTGLRLFDIDSVTVQEAEELHNALMGQGVVHRLRLDHFNQYIGIAGEDMRRRLGAY